MHWKRLFLSAPMFACLWLAQPRTGAPAGERPLPRAAPADAVTPTLMAHFLTAPPTTTTTTAPAPPTTTTTSAPGWQDPVTEEERAEWSRVNMCEEHGDWHVRGTSYSGGLGISEANWVRYGGARDFGPEWSASPDQQIVVAMRIQQYPPDQHGCTGAW